MSGNLKLSTKQAVIKVLRVIFPAGSKRRIIGGKIKQIILGTHRNKYKKWIQKYELLSFVETQTTLEAAENRPLVSILVPCYNTPKRYIDDLVESVQAQIYDNWQLCIADGSTDEEKSNYIRQLCSADERIRYVKVGENKGIVGNTNEALQIADGDYVAFMDHDDVLSPYALAENVILLNQHPDADLIYSDEDKLTDDGKKRVQPLFKPDWSPELLHGINYITHFVVVRAATARKIGGLRTGFDGAQDYDFLLRATEVTDKIYHIPKILYHWRMAVGSTAKQVDEKGYAATAGQRALAEYIQRTKTSAIAIPVENRPTTYRLKYNLPAKTSVSIIIPFKDKVEYLQKLVPSILEKSGDIDYEVLLISNNSTEEKTHAYLKQISEQEPKVKVFEYNMPFNYSEINNFGRRQAKGDYLVFLNNDMEVITDNWLAELISVAAQPGVGAVGPLLLYPDDRIQHAGVVLGMHTMAGHVFRFRREHDITPFGIPSWPRNYLAVTGACLAVATSTFDEVKGFDEMLTITGNDVALCLSIYERGYRNVYWPFVQLYHYESVSVGSYDNGRIGDYNRSLEYYRPYLNHKDPYFSPNLSLMHESIDFRSSYE